MTPDVRDQLQVPGNIKGAVITNVVPGSPADNAGLSRGDVIVEVNRKPVNGASDAKQDFSNVPQGKEVLVLVWAKGGSVFRVLHPAEAQPPGD